MSSLTQVAITTRKIIRYGVLFILFLIVGRILLLGAISIYKKLFPAPPPAPTVTYGKLPKLPFPSKTNPQGTSYTLETTEVGLPKLPNQAKVFFMLKPSPNLLSLSTAQNKAESLGFNSNGEQITPTTYRFPNQYSPSTLEINIISGVFSVSYDLKTDPSPLANRPPVPEVAAAQVRSYLSSANLLPPDLTGPTEHEFLKLSGGQFVSVISLSESNLVKINLFRKTYDNLSSLTPDPKSANVWFMVSGSAERGKQEVAGEFHYFAVDESQFSTYPIKTPDAAWKEFSSGEGYIASQGTNKDNAGVKIRKVYLAYYDSDVSTDFFQPIFVFEGDNGFRGYLPAVTADYYGE